jgi:hypothetical protein
VETEETSEEKKGGVDQSFADDGNSMMSKFTKRFKWSALIPVIAGIFLLLLGYYLDTEVVKILGIILVGFFLVLLY